MKWYRPSPERRQLHAYRVLITDDSPQCGGSPIVRRGRLGRQRDYSELSKPSAEALAVAIQMKQGMTGDRQIRV